MLKSHKEQESDMSSPFSPGDLIKVKLTGKNGTITRVICQYYCEVHIGGKRVMIQNEDLIMCNLENTAV